MDTQLAISLIESEVYENPVISLYPDECQALWEAIVNLVRTGQVTAAIGPFKAALGVAFKAGREDAQLDTFRDLTGEENE